MNSKVTVFHTLDNSPRTFTFQPVGAQASSIGVYLLHQADFGSMARGWKRVEKLPADVVVAFAYGIDNGRTSVSSRYRSMVRLGAASLKPMARSAPVGGREVTPVRPILRPRSAWWEAKMWSLGDTLATSKSSCRTVSHRTNLYEATVETSINHDNFTEVSDA